MKEEDKQIQNEEYNEYVKQVTPTNNLFGNMVKAFIVGGVICVIGQVILNVAMNRFGLDKETAGSWCSMLLILLSIILTGFNIYPTFAKGRCRSIGANHRICQFRSFAGNRVQKRGSGVWNRM